MSTKKIADLHTAAERGDVAAQFNLGNACWTGDNIAKNKRKAVHWWRKAAEQGFAEAQFNLSSAYFAGKGVAEDQQESVRWLHEAAKQGHVPAQMELAAHYSLQDSLEESVRWYRKAAEQGEVRAQCALARRYLHGKGVEQNPHEAVSWYRKAAEQGDALAQEILGGIYERGEGVDQDENEAMHWYRMAADQADQGDGYVLNLKLHFLEKMRQLRKYAEQGNEQAALELGWAYWRGCTDCDDDIFRYDFAVDVRKAAHWWCKAAEQGNTEAQKMLGMCYLKGDGIITDEREAYMWLSIAKQNGREDAAEILSQDFWYKILSQYEIRLARRAARKKMEKIDRRKAECDKKLGL
ncbi:MAG: SEL1-like repeat protein [Alphaproteobacteria bacterium]|nr:SEL1-like repeat protein [Alphaproteobacteria bacterium]